MKKLLFGLVLLFSIGINAQALQKNTNYTAKIIIDDEVYEYKFEVDNSGWMEQLDGDGKERVFDNQRTISNTVSTTFTWLNSGGIWSESQTFIFTKDKESGDIYVQLFRVVQNEGDEPWTMIGTGMAKKD